MRHGTVPKCVPQEVTSLSSLVNLIIHRTFARRAGHSSQEKVPRQRHGRMNLHAAAGAWDQGGEGDKERKAEDGLILAKDQGVIFAASLCPLVAALKTYMTLHLFTSGEPDPL